MWIHISVDEVVLTLVPFWSIKVLVPGWRCEVNDTSLKDSVSVVTHFINLGSYQQNRLRNTRPCRLGIGFTDKITLVNDGEGTRLDVGLSTDSGVLTTV